MYSYRDESSSVTPPPTPIPQNKDTVNLKFVVKTKYINYYINYI